ncbi:MAG: lipopolysaccharide kinase InaA family protein [Gemmatimonadaceae bacterium]
MPALAKKWLEGFEYAEVGGTTLVARYGRLEEIRGTLASGTLYDYAARHRASRALSGRGIVYAVPLPTGERVVVRRNRHGGLFGRLTGDLFLPPSRAPFELLTSLRLARHGVPTPEIVAYLIYPAKGILCRSDVISREIPESVDLAAILTSDDERRRRTALKAAATLIGQLSACGARHHDLNVKNVLLARSGSSTGEASLTAYVLDVDRVEFEGPGDTSVTEGNLQRFMRSARKWRALHNARVDETELAALAETVRRFVAANSSTDSPPRARS